MLKTECPIRYITQPCEIKGNFPNRGRLPFFHNTGGEKVQAVLAVDFSCIHPVFRAGRRYLCQSCANKYVYAENGKSLQQGIYHVHKIVSLKIECQLCASGLK